MINGLKECTPHKFLADGPEIVCRQCGWTILIYTPPQAPFDCSMPVHRILPYSRGLGSELDTTTCRRILRPGLRFEGKAGYEIAKRSLRLYREARPNRDPLTEGILSDVWGYLKQTYPTDDVSDTAARLALEEVRFFRLKYPDLKPQHLREQLVANVISEMSRIYPTAALRQPALRGGVGPW